LSWAVELASGFGPGLEAGPVWLPEPGQASRSAPGSLG
jgi:hypothetical protein